MAKQINTFQIKNLGTATNEYDTFEEEENKQLKRSRKALPSSAILNKITSKGELDFSNNSLCYLPREVLLSDFPQVKVLNISKNSFTDISDTMVRSLPRLEELNASLNKIAFITSEISEWKDSLRKLILSNNQISEMPNELTCLVNLQYLVLNDNRMEYLPSNISNLTKLKMLDVGNNLFESLPYELGSLTNLKRLNIGNNNNLIQIPTSLCELDKLERIQLEWLIYAPRIVDTSVLEHGQSDERKSSILRRSQSDSKRERLAQFKYIIKEFDIKGQEFVDFIEFIRCRRDNINNKDSRQRTKINIASKEGHYMVVEQLLKHGADPNIYDKDKFTALGLAVREGHDEIAGLLLKSYPDSPSAIELNKGAGYLGSPLHIAVVKHKIEIVKKMLILGADINASDNEGNTPLHQLISIYSKNEIESLKILKVLMTDNGFNKADLKAQNSCGLTPLLVAIKRKQKGGVRDILKETQTRTDLFDINAIDPTTGFNALFLLFKHKMADLAEKAFLKGANSLLYIPGGWKRCRYDEESFKSKYIIRKMKKFQLRKKFKVPSITSLQANEAQLLRNRIDQEEGYHCVGHVIKKKKISRHPFIRKYNRDRHSMKINFQKFKSLAIPADDVSDKIL